MKKAYLDVMCWQTIPKTFENQSHLVDFFGNNPQGKGRGGRVQHQLIVNWEVSNTRFSDGSVGL
jgi:hypothetical protein